MRFLLATLLLLLTAPAQAYQTPGEAFGIPEEESSQAQPPARTEDILPTTPFRPSERQGVSRTFSIPPIPQLQPKPEEKVVAPALQAREERLQARQVRQPMPPSTPVHYAAQPLPPTGSSLHGIVLIAILLITLKKLSVSFLPHRYASRPSQASSRHYFLRGTGHHSRGAAHSTKTKC